MHTGSDTYGIILKIFDHADQIDTFIQSTTPHHIDISLWGQMGPNSEVESIYGHIFVKNFHILIIFGQMIANWDTKNLINPIDLD